MQQERLDKEKNKAQQRLDEIKKKTKAGTEVPMANIITEVSSGRDLTDIYLKHPANESSEDEDGTENIVENKDEENFDKFVAEQIKKQKEKIKISSVTENI